MTGDPDIDDVLVVGAGPAGLATAIHAALAGLSVTVLEPRTAPIDKACGEGLMPGAVRALEALGVALEGRPFHGIRYLDGPHVAEARFSTGAGLGVRRTVLQDAMHRRAHELGVRFATDRVRTLSQRPGIVELNGPRGPRARYVVGADGLHSTVRDLIGLPATSPAPRRFGVRRHYRCAPWSDLVEVHWSAHGEAYVTPVADDLVGVAVLARRGSARFDDVLAELPDLRARLTGAPAGPDLGAGPLRQHVPQRTAGRVLLVGDAAGYVDALTGEGIRLAVEEAAAAVAAIRDDRPERYEAAWRAITRDYRRATGALVRATGFGPVRRRLVPAAARFPGLFGRAVDGLACGELAGPDGGERAVPAPGRGAAAGGGLEPPARNER